MGVENMRGSSLKRKKRTLHLGTFNKVRNGAEGHARVSWAKPQEQYVVYVCLSHTDPTGCCYTKASRPTLPWVRTVTWAAVRPHPQSPLSIAQGTSCSLWAPRGLGPEPAGGTTSQASAQKGPAGCSSRTQALSAPSAM